MTLLSRSLQQQADPADIYMALLINYPPERRFLGVTLGDMARDYPNKFDSESKVRAAIAAFTLLAREGKVYEQRSSGRPHFLDSIKVSFPGGFDIPPSQEAVRTDRHLVGDHTVVIHIYKTAEGKFFVWPYIERVSRDSAGYVHTLQKHFPLRGHFDDVQAALRSAITQGTTLVEVGFDLDSMD